LNAGSTAVLSRAEIQIISFRASRRFALNLRFLRWRDPRLQFPCYLLGHCSLDGENVCHLSVVTVPPYLPVIPRVDEPRFYTNAIPGPLHAALDDGRDPQRLGDFTRVAGTLLVLHHRGARDDPQIADHAHLPQQLVVETLREIGVLLAGAQTGE